MITRHWVVCVIAVALGLSACSSNDSRTLDEEMEVLLQSIVAEYQLPGVTAAYVLADGTTGTVAAGFSDVERSIAMTPDSRMLAASIGKTIISALVFNLEVEGILQRSDLISEYLSHKAWFEELPNASTITIDHLLTHRSGLADHVHLDGVAAELIGSGSDVDFQPEDAIGYIAGLPPLFAAGEGWAYSDTGYIVLGLVIEEATGRDIFELVQERLLIPLGLSQTSPSNSATIDELAVGYTAADNPFGLPERTMNDQGQLVWNPVIEWTGGGFVSTSRDLAAWGHALFTGTAIQGASLDQMLVSYPISPDAPSIHYGSGVAMYRETELGDAYGHGGWIPGYVSSLRHYPDFGVTIAFQINSDIGTYDEGRDAVPTLEQRLAQLIVHRP